MKENPPERLLGKTLSTSLPSSQEGRIPNLQIGDNRILLGEAQEPPEV